MPVSSPPMPPPGGLLIAPITGLGEICAGDDIAALITQSARGILADGDIVIVSSKVVSKAEGRTRPAAEREAAIDAETVRLVAQRRTPEGLTRIVENRLGLVMAAAGVDASNTPAGTILLLPLDPDASARAIRRAIQTELGLGVGVIIADSAGRPWRRGVTDFAIGAAGLRVLDDLRGTPDANGRPLTSTVVAVADELAAATELVRAKSAGVAAALVRGAAHWLTDDDGPGASQAIRPPSEDLFRTGTIEP